MSKEENNHCSNIRLPDAAPSRCEFNPVLDDMKFFIEIQDSYNYPKKFKKAAEEGNIKYIQSLIDRGKLIVHKII